MTKNEYHIPVTSNGNTGLDVLAEASGLSRQKIKLAMQKGCVWLEQSDSKGKQFVQRLRRAKKALKQNDVLHCYYNEEILEVEPPKAKLIIDEGDYSVWNKPCGMFSQGSKWSDHCTVYRWAERNMQPERSAFLVHRLDRAANGLILLAHKKQVAAKFSEMFQRREVIKNYQVLVLGNFSGLIDNNSKEMRKTIDEDLDGKKAISHITMVEYNECDDQSLLDVLIETGRKHQIRRHLSHVGFPVVGDRIYGNAISNNETDLQLSAVRLEFECPITHKKKRYQI